MPSCIVYSASSSSLKIVLNNRSFTLLTGKLCQHQLSNNDQTKIDNFIKNTLAGTDWDWLNWLLMTSDWAIWPQLQLVKCTLIIFVFLHCSAAFDILFRENIKSRHETFYNNNKKKEIKGILIVTSVWNWCSKFQKILQYNYMIHETYSGSTN